MDTTGVIVAVSTASVADTVASGVTVMTTGVPEPALGTIVTVTAEVPPEDGEAEPD